MDRHQRQLWLNIDDFKMDIGDESLTFAGRLAQENDWDIQFASRVVDEYKKFIYLMVAAGHPVTPSDEVDQAWHLHLTYTRSYWDRLCGEVLGKPLHHNPTKGGASENNKFDDWYRRTLASYAEHFGAPAPADIWPPSEVRFAPANQFHRVKRSEAWIVSKSRVGRIAAMAGIAGLLAVIVGCANTFGGDSDVVYILIPIGVMIATLFIALAVERIAAHNTAAESGAARPVDAAAVVAPAKPALDAARIVQTAAAAADAAAAVVVAAAADVAAVDAEEARESSIE